MIYKQITQLYYYIIKDLWSFLMMNLNNIENRFKVN